MANQKRPKGCSGKPEQARITRASHGKAKSAPACPRGHAEKPCGELPYNPLALKPCAPTGSGGWGAQGERLSQNDIRTMNVMMVFLTSNSSHGIAAYTACYAHLTSNSPKGIAAYTTCYAQLTRRQSREACCSQAKAEGVSKGG